MADEKPKFPEGDVFIEHSEQVKAQMEKDPKLAEYLREFQAILRQAMHGVKTGQYASFEDAMEAISGHRPEKVDSDDLPDEFKITKDKN